MDVRQARLIRRLLRWVCDRRGHKYEIRIETVEGQRFEIKTCKRCRHEILPSGFITACITAAYRKVAPKLKAALTDENPLLAAMKERGRIRELNGDATIIDEVKGIKNGR